MATGYNYRVRSLGTDAWIVLCAVLLSLGCEKAGTGRNVLLLTFDTTRVDALSVYGGPEAQTPVLDALSKESLRFENAITTAPYTGPSHASILTGLYPMQHGLRDYLEQALPPSAHTLAEILKEHGYQTAAFISTYVLDARYGLDQGFDVYSTPQPAAGATRRWERPARETLRDMARWLVDRDPERPFFVWLHLYDAHAPYAPPPRFRDAEVVAQGNGSLRAQRHLYYREVTYMDDEIGRLLVLLRKAGVYDSLLIVFAADHGELLGEHGRPLETHSPVLFDSTIRVPLLLRFPGIVEPGVTDRQVSVIDVFPTLLDALDLEVPEGTEGRSLLREEARRPVYSETFYEFYPKRAQEGHELASLRDGDWKLIARPGREELYHLGDDPDELRDVSDREADRVARMRRELARLRSGWVGDAPARLEMTEEQEAEHLEKLRSLGYVE